jgi:hypothetical protein
MKKANKKIVLEIKCKLNIMKKIICIFIFGAFINTYAQDIEKMDKKELRVAYQELNASKKNLEDSLFVILNEIKLINKNQVSEINNLNQSLLISQNKIKENDNKIIELQITLKSQEEKIKALSVKPLKLNTFSKIPEEFKKNCHMTYSENKQSFQSKAFILFENKDLNQCLIYIDDKPIFINFKEDKEDENGELTKVYSNESLTISISNQEGIGGTETIHIYKALITIKDKEGQEIKLKVYGEGGC